MIFAFLALLVAVAALVTAGAAYGRSNDAKRRVNKIEAAGVIGSSANVRLQEFSIVTSASVVKAGRVTLNVSNVGGDTHEVVIVRAANVAALPLVTTAGDRSVGAIDEEAIAEADKAGETGDIKAQAHAVRRFDLTPGTYVMFCNIDTKSKDATVTNHFAHGMHAVLTVV